MLPNVAFGRRRALTCPTVKVWLIPSGAPTTKISSPTSALSESPSVAGCTPAGTRSSCSKATSAAGSEATMLALMSASPGNSTATASAVCTTCAAVSTLPSVLMSTPDPSPGARTSCALERCPARTRSVVRTTTTAPPTRLNACDTDGTALAAIAGAPMSTAANVTNIRACILEALFQSSCRATAGAQVKGSRTGSTCRTRGSLAAR